MFGSHGKWWTLVNITAIAYISGLHRELLFPDPPVHLLYIRPMIGATPTTQAWYDLFNWHKLDDFIPSNFWLVLQYYLWPTWKNVEPHKPLLSQFKCPIHLHMHAIATVASYPRLAPCVLALPPSTCWCSIATVDSLCRSPTQKLMNSCGYPANISNLAGQIFVSAAK
jgi:hypothetical protein